MKSSPTKKINRPVLIGLCVAAVVLVAALCLLLPRVVTDKTPDLSSGDWVITRANQRMKLPGVEAYDTAVVTYTTAGVNLHLSYTSKEDTATMQDKYRKLLGLPPSDVESDNLFVASYVDGAPVTVSGSFTEPSYHYSVVMGVTQEDESQRLTKLVSEGYPEELVTGNAKLAPLVTEEYGGFVFYQYGDNDVLRYPDLPQYSRAYDYAGDAASFDRLVLDIAADYPDSIWDGDNHVLIFEQDGWRYVVSLVLGEQNNLASIGLQEIPAKSE